MNEIFIACVLCAKARLDKTDERLNLVVLINCEIEDDEFKKFLTDLECWPEERFLASFDLQPILADERKRLIKRGKKYFCNNMLHRSVRDSRELHQLSKQKTIYTIVGKLTSSLSTWLGENPKISRMNRIQCFVSSLRSTTFTNADNHTESTALKRISFTVILLTAVNHRSARLYSLNSFALCFISDEDLMGHLITNNPTFLFDGNIEVIKVRFCFMSSNYSIVNWCW